MEDGTFGYVLSIFWFKVETDVGIDECFALFWLLETRSVVAHLKDCNGR
jgi:hypothetical protein